MRPPEERETPVCASSNQETSGSVDASFPDEEKGLEKIGKKYNVELKKLPFLSDGLAGAGSYSFSGRECSLALRKILVNSIVKIEEGKDASAFRSEKWKQYRQLKKKVDNWISALNHWIRDYHGEDPTDTYVNTERLNRIIKIIFRDAILSSDQKSFHRLTKRLVEAFETKKQAISSFLIQ